MKRLLIYLFLVINVKGLVLNQTENSEARYINERLTKENVEVAKSVQDESRVYLDDVMFMLKNQNWTLEEKPCLDTIYLMLQNLQNFTLWAVWAWDTQSSEPQGLLFGNRYQLGNFDQCLNAPWSDKHKNLRFKYCLADIILERTDKDKRKPVDKPLSPYQSALDFIEYRPPHTRPLNEITWGVCAPVSCQPKTIERLTEIMLNRSHLGAAGIKPNIAVTEECQISDQHREYDGLFYGFISLVGILVILNLICTYLNNRKNDSSEETKKSAIIEAFCLRENASNLLKMKKDGIEVFYGIRFLTMCFIVLDHQIGIYNSGPISDGLLSDKDAQSAVGMLVLHDDLFVDTFFLLSGFLTCVNFVRFKVLPNPIFLILKRYVRLIVAYAIVIFFISAIYPYTGSGPLWNRAVAHDTDQCRKNWWLNLLMVSNYVDTENICIVVSWYIPCDFQFFVVTVILFWIYKHLPRLGLLLASVVTIASLVLPAIINYMYQLSAVQLFTFEFVMNPRASEDFHLAYIKSHTRYAAYLVGFFSGYIFAKYNAKSNTRRISVKWSVLGTFFAIVLMLVVMMVGSTFLWRDYNSLEGAMYAALNRPAWACGVAAIVLCCSLGDVPIVKKFLSWYPWVPLSRLAYGLYLVHHIIITHNVFVTRNPQHNDYFEILILAGGVTVYGCVVALLLWLFAEAPANNLLTLILKPKSRRTEASNKNQPTISVHPSISTLPTSSSGHLQDNLPNTVHFSSKF
ncbi:nose resistant to fluoxetine protein 6 [Manduca sexta]|uniref:nose resistant to fluoxetine protein 6 n=1 Tax=Manduca sexta TaxID=7130 RepID=UPI00188EE86B|nr:nose resistant to fluoxetine protein 6 [Manduca sexta]